MAAVSVPPRAEAVQILHRGADFLRAQIDGVSTENLIRRGTIGGGEWSAKDLIAHVTFWERNGLEALQAWSRDQVAPVDRMLKAPGIDAINAASIEASFAFDLSEALDQSASVHAALVGAIEALSDEAWRQPPTSRGEKSLSERLGVLLVGRGDDLFDHVSAHAADLEVFVAQLRDVS